MQATTDPTLPKHIAIIMDGNGRWAQQRGQARVAGHRAGVASVRRIVRACTQKNIQVLTLFAFGQENWRRPLSEISYLHSLLFSAVQRELDKLIENNIRLRVIGDMTGLSSKLQQRLQDAVVKTQTNTGMWLVVAFNYSGQWDITQAMQMLARQVAAGQLTPKAITQETIESALSTAGLPMPDLFIRTSGECRLSNFLLWQLAYTELYFTDVYWPDFTEAHLQQALSVFEQRERRFGYINTQLQQVKSTDVNSIHIDTIEYDVPSQEGEQDA